MVTEPVPELPCHGLEHRAFPPAPRPSVRTARRCLEGLHHLCDIEQERSRQPVGRVPAHAYLTPAQSHLIGLNSTRNTTPATATISATVRNSSAGGSASM